MGGISPRIHKSLATVGSTVGCQICGLHLWRLARLRSCWWRRWRCPSVAATLACARTETVAMGRMGLVVYIVYMGGEGGSCWEFLKLWKIEQIGPWAILRWLPELILLVVFGLLLKDPFFPTVLLTWENTSDFWPSSWDVLVILEHI